MSGELTDYQQENPQKPDREKARFEFDWQPLTLALAVVLACYVSGHGDDLIYYLLYLPIVVLIHELGHVVAGRLFGCEIERLQVFFVPFITYRPREEKSGAGGAPSRGDLECCPSVATHCFGRATSGKYLPPRAKMRS